MNRLKPTLVALAVGGLVAGGAQAQQTGQQSGEGAVSEQAVKEFFTQTETTLKDAVTQQNYGSIRDYLNEHLADGATFWASQDLHLGDRKIASTMLTIDKDLVERLTGMFQGAMNGRGSIENYDLTIEVTSVEPMGQDAAKVMTNITESGQFTAKMAQDTQGGQADPSTATRQSQQQDEATGATGQGGSTQFQAQSECTHMVRADEQGALKLASTVCNGATHVGGGGSGSGGSGGSGGQQQQ